QRENFDGVSCQLSVVSCQLSVDAATRMTWTKLLATAEAEVAATLQMLPPPFQASPRHLPVTYEPRPNDALLADGYEPDWLGLFVGPSFGDEAKVPLPPQIILFLKNLWEMAEEAETFYREEVRTTYLHELGHYLGLDEIDLEERGLE